MANEWLKGAIPFVDYVDVKPIGIYGLFAVAIGVLGKSLISVRILAALFIAGTAFFIYRILSGFHRSKSFSLGSALLFIFFASLHKWAWASNTEIFFVFFTAWGASILLKAEKSTHFLSFGFILGLGFIIKYHVLFDFTALGLFWIISNWKKLTFFHISSRMLLSFAAFLLPFALVNLYYLAIQNYPEFLEASFGIPSRYSNSPDIWKRLQFLGEFYLAYLPFSVLLFWGFFDKQKDQKLLLLSALWMTMVWIAIFATGKSFFHYYYQALLPLAIYTLEILRVTSNKILIQLKRNAWSLLLIVSIILLVSQGTQLKKLAARAQPVVALQNDLQEFLSPMDRVYIQKKNVLYFTLDKSPIERFVHNTLMYSDDHIHAFGIDLDEEFERINWFEPKAIVVPENGNARLDSLLNSKYELRNVYSPNLVLWTKKSEVLPISE